MGQVAKPSGSPSDAVRRRRIQGHPFLTRWTARRTLAVFVFCVLLLLITANLDPRIRAGIRYFRPPSGYTVPVAGIAPADLRSTWNAPRSGGRKHKGVDIFAPRGAAVVSATDGVVWSVTRNRLGGNVVFVLGEGLSVYYYAHLDAWAPELEAGSRVRAGDVLGAVGTSGNAAGTPPHLHFGVTKLSIFGATDLDPVPLLSGGRSLPEMLLADGVTEPPEKNTLSRPRETIAAP